VASCHPLPGYRVARAAPYRSWLSPTAETRVLLLERDGGD
jgi:hypothetical protein